MVLPNLYHLKYFLDAVDSGSISAAADKNLVTHPAISRAIKALEEQLEVRLLVHKKKSFEVTTDGLALAERARELLQTAKDFNADNLSTKADPAGTVVLAISRTIGQSYLSSILKEVENKYSKLKVHVRFGTTGEIVERVTSGTVDLGISIGHQKMATLKQTLLRKGEFILVSSKSKKVLTNKDISESTFILTEPRNETEVLKKEFYRKYKIPMQIKHEVSSWDMITNLVGHAEGIGLVPDISLMGAQKSSLAQVKSDWFNCSYEIYLHESKSVQNSTAVKSLVDVIKNII